MRELEPRTCTRELDHWVDVKPETYKPSKQKFEATKYFRLSVNKYVDSVLSWVFWLQLMLPHCYVFNNCRWFIPTVQWNKSIKTKILIKCYLVFIILHFFQLISLLSLNWNLVQTVDKNIQNCFIVCVNMHL